MERKTSGGGGIIERKVLGKGLNALIPQKTAAILPKEFIYLPLEKIKPGKYQPRQDIEDAEELKELSQSIKERGFIQPIVVRKIEGGYYEIVAGGRRYQAANSLGLKEIPTIIRDLDDKDTLILAVIENLQRKDLNPLEEAEAFARLIREFNFSLENIAQFISKDKTTIVNTLRLLKLPPRIKQALRRGLLTRSQARTILGVEGEEEQEKLFEEILKKGLSVREVERKVGLIRKKKKKVDPHVLEVEEELQKSLGTKVRIFNRRNNRGRVVIEYYTLEDLERIVNKLGSKPLVLKAKI